MSRQFLKNIAALDLSEDAEQMIVCQHVAKRGVDGLLFWHTPNGGERSSFVGAKMKALGTLAGIPDLFFLYLGHLYGIEMKKRKGGTPTKSQKIVIPKLNAAGATVVYAYGADEAMDYLEAWGLLAGRRWGIRVEGIRGFAGHLMVA